MCPGSPHAQHSERHEYGTFLGGRVFEPKPTEGRKFPVFFFFPIFTVSGAIPPHRRRQELCYRPRSSALQSTPVAQIVLSRRRRFLSQKRGNEPSCLTGTKDPRCLVFFPSLLAKIKRERDNTKRSTSLRKSVIGSFLRNTSMDYSLRDVTACVDEARSVLY